MSQTEAANVGWVDYGRSGEFASVAGDSGSPCGDRISSEEYAAAIAAADAGDNCHCAKTECENAGFTWAYDILPGYEDGVYHCTCKGCSAGYGDEDVDNQGQCEALGCSWDGNIWQHIEMGRTGEWQGCSLPASWREISQEERRYETGGLGRLMIEDEYEVWLCDWNFHSNCEMMPYWPTNDLMCFTYNERTKIFEPLGLNSQLHFVRINDEYNSTNSSNSTAYWESSAAFDYSPGYGGYGAPPTYGVHVRSINCTEPCKCMNYTNISSGVLSDGSGPNQDYSHDANCWWIIAPGEPYSSELHLVFNSFETEEGYDFVTVFECFDVSCEDVSEIYELSGNLSMPVTVSTNTGIMFITFTSDASVGDSGFSAVWSVGYGGKTTTFDFTKGLSGKAEDQVLSVADGDEIEFTWTGGHNVYLMKDKTAFDSCSWDGSTVIGETSGANRVISGSDGTVQYFACKVGPHCTSGQKLAVTIGARSSGVVFADATAGGGGYGGGATRATTKRHRGKKNLEERVVFERIQDNNKLLSATDNNEQPSNLWSWLQGTTSGKNVFRDEKEDALVAMKSRLANPFAKEKRAAAATALGDADNTKVDTKRRNVSKSKAHATSTGLERKTVIELPVQTRTAKLLALHKNNVQEELDADELLKGGVFDASEVAAVKTRNQAKIAAFKAAHPA